MDKSLEIKIITPDKVIYDSGDVQAITIPTMGGEIKVLPNHIPLITPLRTGEVVFEKDGVNFGIAVYGGVLEIRDNNQVVLLVEQGEMARDIDIERAEVSYKRAEEAMKMQVNEVEVDYAKFKGQLERELNRIRVAKKWRK